MRNLQLGLLSLWFVLASSFPALSQDSTSSAPQVTASDAPAQSGITLAPPPASFNEVMDRVIEKEHLFVAQMRHMRPMVETYLQDLKSDSNGTAEPVKDQYFLGRLDMSDGPEDTSFVGQPGFGRRMAARLTGLYSMHFLPLGFAQMVVLDSDFQRKYYNFNFVRREFLGEVRCLVIDVQPRENAPPGRFLGRIWVEDQDYNVVRFNGTYYPHPKTSFYLHFDSWRLNMRPGTWLPAYVFSEETNMKTTMGRNLHFRAQTRLWGYDLKALNKNAEFTQILVDSPQSVKDQSDAAADATPVVAERMWERQAEDNAVERLQKIGLLAPSGEVDKILLTVVNNLLVTNNIDLQSDVRCRVLLTSPLESFTIGHTIVISRGLLDVLPDEASLAMVLAHELSHIVLGHQFDTKLAFNDRLFFPDEDSFQRLDFKRHSADEDAADAKALELLKNSPYKDKLGTAGLFLKALQQSAPELPNLIRPHLGDSVASNKSIRMSALLSSAPQLEPQRTDQIAALPLGGRIKLDPWTDQVELAKAKPVALVSAREKMPFEITPFFPYLTRLSTVGSDNVAVTAPNPK
ncbi:MAG TPA: M48 family metalloprotease [Candidatus Acidoferrales bacterium]|nr:M48 family metalloprotease [Candidatus Acidoferrales bacterium]